MSESPEFSSGVQKQLLAGLKIFNVASLTSDEDIATAVAVLEGTLDDHSMAPIIRCSLQLGHPYAFEFMISSVNDVTCAYILDFVLDKFPSESNVSAFRSSLGYEIVSRLSRSLSRLPYPSNGRPEGLDDRCHDTQRAPATLEDLSILLQSGFLEEAESEGRSNRRTTQQSRGSRGKGTTDVHTEIYDRLFQILGSQVPRTRESAEEMIKSIVDSQKDTLKFFFALLQRPQLTELFRNAYFRGNTHQGRKVDTALPQAMGATHSLSATGGDPIRADLYFPPAAGFGQWRILCSRAFLSDMTRDSALSKAVLERLRELSLGCFSETNQMRLAGDSPIGVFRARLPGGARMVYLIDVVPEFGRDHEIQVLRILGIYSMDKLNRTNWQRVGRYQAMKGREYIGKCKARKSRGGFYYDPMTFDATATQVETISTDPVLQDQEMEEMDEIHRLFDLEQYSVLSQNIIRDILEGHEYSHIFQVSWEEKKVIEFTKSSFVLGRSGTGKTTVIVFKIFGIERAWQNQGSIGPRPRQLFLTKSQLLANKVEHEYVDLLFSLYAGPDTPQYICERIKHWNSRRKNNALDQDGAEGMRDDLPEKFSELQDGHFPLFITVDTLWSLLEADMKPSPSESQHSRSQQKNSKWLGRTDLVTFDVFKRAYWCHFPQTLIKGIGVSFRSPLLVSLHCPLNSHAVPSVAFGDIIGTIKGSEKSLEFPNRALDRGAYESLTNRSYAVFEAYQKLKRERRERDPADRTHDLLNRIKESGLKGELVDFVYVDEVQDLLLIDARLIVSLCRNPDGFLWAGDTAQTISIGSTFSFKQLGAFVYRYQRSIQSVRGTPSQPKGFQLLVNYRSHAGIVKCANAIIQLLQRFPGAIDVLQPEAGIAGKAMPVFFHSGCLPSQERDFFLLSTGQPCMLGSKQCIIVRDDAARQRLKEDIGRVGIILTLLNSKGLEYDDVILYNFFGESADANLWQHLTDAHFRPLEGSKHAALIYELKCLYVAITRARHRLWIVDYSNVCLPIKRHLLNLGLVSDPPTSRNPIEHFTNISTTPKEWSEAGKRLLHHEEFEEAAMAFLNAGDDYMHSVAMACHLREVARDTPESAPKRRKEAFASAAPAARCYAEIGRHTEVVRILKRVKMYTEAASYCFDNNLLKEAVSLIKTFKIDQETTNRIKQAARLSYLEAKNIDEAAKLFDNEGELMEFIVQHELWVARAAILRKQKKYREAVRQYLDEGEELDALEIALEHIDEVTQDPDTFNAIIAKILWRYLSFGCRGWSERTGIPASKVNKLLEAIPLRGLRSREQQMLSLFKLIFLGRTSTTSQKTLADHILHCNPLDKVLKLLALDFYFDDMSSALDVSSQSGFLSSLQLFHEYSLLMRDGALDKAPWNSPWLCTLFQIERYGEKVRIKRGTLLYEHCTRGGSSRPKEQIKLSRQMFSKSLNRLLWERLNTRISEKDRVSSSLSLFDPCIQPRPILHETCCSDHLDEGWFNRRVRLHLQHMMILDNLHAFELTKGPERMESQRRLLGALESALNPLYYLSGSLASLNKGLIPEAADAFATVQRWALDVLSNLDPSQDDHQGAFLTELFKAFTLTRLRQHGRVVNECLRRITCAWNHKDPRLVVCHPDGSQIYRLRDFLAFLDGSGSLEQGIEFFSRYLVQERLPVDLAVLCTIVERLFGLAIMTARHRDLGSLHDVLLPRTWILSLWGDFLRFKNKSLAPLEHLVQATGKLLGDIYTGEYQRHAIMDPGPQIRTPPDLKNKAPNLTEDIPPEYIQDLCVTRMCLCLLGENFGVLRDDIHVALSLKTVPSPESVAFHGRYINTQKWEELEQALYQSTTSPFDRLVRLRLESSSISGPQIPGVDLITFKDMNALIPNVLHSRPGDHPITTSGSHESTGGSDAAITGHAAEYFEDDAFDIGDGEGPDRSREALIIQKAVRRYLLNSSSDKLKAKRDRHFEACKASADAVHARYRKIYLGPVPHLLLCLEWIISSAQQSKDTIKARRREATLQELEDLTSQQTQIARIVKEAHDLRKRLEPRSLSTLHPRVSLPAGWDATRDLEPVRSAMLKVKDLFERLSDSRFPTVEFECAWNGIMPSKFRK
ncbi:hypothetical protein EDB92DRAFT_2117028 [Lactarius akahatsu]|uniref:UvrD-like helicase ATP-binding domain-containing protein n=1 Tax=Lactarius akahatsu TaxID=416441 RepID=A0AAD4L8P5_9AGAM|nr:hypothetical protein EDB92DRAFT_2117028 [Lactarius akahatsu]